jgi:very-short-patch-repair endonuclease
VGGLRRETLSFERRLSILLRRQHGVVSRPQLRSLGLGDDAIDARARKGALLRVDRGVYAAGHDDIIQLGRWLAAVLASGSGAVLSHLSAATLWGLWKAERHIHVSAPQDRRNRKGVTVHRSTQLPSTDVTRRHGIPVTRPPRTLLDLAEVTARRPLERALDEAQRLRLCPEGDLRAGIAAHPGRIGAARLMAVLDEHALGSTLTENDFEELFLAICDAHGLPRPRSQEWLMGYRVDFLWREERLVVETDGRATHTTDRAFESDRARDNELGSAGWAVRRFTWRQLTKDPAWVAAKVEEALARLTRTSIEKS